MVGKELGKRKINILGRNYVKNLQKKSQIPNTPTEEM